jgi:hypothetical protein
MALVTAESTDIDATLAQGRARLLLTAVRHSVLRWEQHRGSCSTGGKINGYD